MKCQVDTDNNSDLAYLRLKGGRMMSTDIKLTGYSKTSG